MSQPAAPVLAVKQLTLQFGGLTAVNQVNFDVKKGEIFAVIGPNGAGKTTVFNAVTGVYQPTRGHVLFEGRHVRRPFTPRTAAGFTAAGLLAAIAIVFAWNAQELWQAAIIDNYVYQQPFAWGQAAVALLNRLREMPASQTLWPALLGFALGAAGTAATWFRARRTPDLITCEGIARTFQNVRLFPEMTVTENVLVGMHAKLSTRFWHAALRLPRYWREKNTAAAEAAEILRFVGLAHHANTLADNLAYGHKRRLEIARALATRPCVLLLDEPAAGMNPAETVALMQLIRDIRAKGISILLIEHDMKLVMGVSDRIAVLDYGNKIAEGAPDEIQRDPKVIEAYLGADIT